MKATDIKEAKRQSAIQLRNAKENAAIAIMIAGLPRSPTTLWYINMALRAITVKLNAYDKPPTKYSVALKREIAAAKARGITPPKGIGEHAVPISLFSHSVRDNLHNMTVDELLEVARGHIEIVRITPEEDERLKRAGLVKKMPPDWDGNDIYARYHAVGIEIAD
jgi:hypothetical protein